MRAFRRDKASWASQRMCGRRYHPSFRGKSLMRQVTVYFLAWLVACVLASGSSTAGECSEVRPEYRDNAIARFSSYPSAFLGRYRIAKVSKAPKYRVGDPDSLLWRYLVEFDVIDSLDDLKRHVFMSYESEADPREQRIIFGAAYGEEAIIAFIPAETRRKLNQRGHQTAPVGSLLSCLPSMVASSGPSGRDNLRKAWLELKTYWQERHDH